MNDQPPEEDSSDLTDADILGAIQTNSVAEIVTALRSIPCKTCSSQVRVMGHAIRRRSPHLYWRVKLLCPHQHETHVFFQSDWVKQGEES